MCCCISTEGKFKLTPISSLLFGQEALVDGEIVSQHMTQSRNPSLLVKIVGKDGAFLTCRFFHFHHRQAEQFKRGMFLRAYGEVLSRYTGLEIVHPNYKIFSENTPPPRKHSYSCLSYDRGFRATYFAKTDKAGNCVIKAVSFR